MTPYFATGSSKLDEEQQEVYVKRFGMRYHHVPEQPFSMNRKQRRKLRFKPKAQR